ncbi:MAG TPA: hypothetical protein DCY13_25225, partial [Verrucomicrobiales bacterium]|nr:hypothetical protein [Verrucomicrobiales bacterium]
RENTLRHMRVEDCGGDGVRFEGAADNNLLEGVTVLRCLNGMRLTGGDVKFNRIIPLDQMGPMDDNVNFGLRLEAGARLNLATVINVRSNGNGGIRVDGAETRFNVLNGVLFQQANTGVLVNGGPGIWVSAPENVFHTFNCAGNLGDGILLEGPDCYGDVLYAIRSGYDSWDSGAWANQGSGIHIRGGAHRIRIGKVEVDDVDGNQEVVHETSYLAGNRDHGIWIEGTNTRDITLNALAVGWGLGLINGDQMLPNGTHGIAITDGARDVSVGGIHRSIKVRIANQTNGAAIYIAGSQTSSNEVFGCEIGYSSIRSYRRGNKVGIHLSEGAFANVIGRRGEAYQVSEAGVIRNYESANEIRGSTEAGILLESGGDPAQTITAGQQPTGGNVIQNNFISGFSSGGQSANRIGIWIRDGAVANRIGGSNPGERNEINYNLEAGILIDGLQVARQNLANRIVGNQLFRNGHTVADPGTPLAGWFQGMGIGLVNNARGNLIGGSLGTEANEIRQNQVGIYLANAISNSVVGNTVRDSKMGGVVLVDSSRNLVGLRNEIYDNGTAALLLGGITITNGSGNRVIGSYVGARFGDNFAFGDGNEPWGIGIFNSADNRIGDHGGDQSNLIVGNLGSGVLISGAGASGNQVANNFVGVAAVAGMFVTGNEGAGIRLENGANNNRIGGTIPLRDKAGVWNAPAGNRIGKSGTDGVHVAGAATTGNSITYNSIADHASGLGIQNVNGGNGEIPSPTVTLVTPAEVKGTVAAGVPDGSLVQVFSDADDEGKVFVGEGLVAGGAFQIPVAAKPFANINATVTHGITGETSEFSTPVVLPPELFAGLHVARTTNPPAAQDIPLNGVPRITMPLKLTASGGPVQITSLSLLATGTVNEATALVGTRLIRDNDKSGDYSSGDEFLAEPIQFTVDDSTRSFLNLDAVILEGETQHWLVEVELDAAMAGVGETVAFEMPSASYIGSQGLFPGSPIAETGEFVIRSDVLSIVPDTGPITFPDWQAIHFSASELSDPAVSGPLGNADNDLLPNVVEYAYGTDPHLDTADPVVAGEHSDAGQTFLTLTFPLVDGLSDIVYGTDTSPDLIGWTTGSFEILSDTLTNGIHLIQLKLLPPVAGVGSRYYRLNIELIP